MRQIGKHRFEIHGEVLYVETEGILDCQEVDAFIKLIDDLSDRQGHVYCIVDLKGGLSLTAEVRRHLIYDRSKKYLTGAAVYGATLLHRALITMIFSAFRLLKKGNTQLIYVDDKLAAQRWVQAQLLQIRLD